MADLTIPILIALIALVTFLLARRRLREDQATSDGGRGARPGTGEHQLTSDYSSGLGGHSTSWTVPRDPQAYAKRFIPKD